MEKRAGIIQKVHAKIDRKINRPQGEKIPLSDGSTITVFADHEIYRRIGDLFVIDNEVAIQYFESSPVHREQNGVLLERKRLNQKPIGIRRMTPEEEIKYKTQFKKLNTPILQFTPLNSKM